MTLKNSARASWRRLKKILLIAYLGLCKLQKTEKNSVDSTEGHSYLLNINYHWYCSWVDYSLGVILANRGNKVRVFLCDGMPYCERLTVTTPRPTCSDCLKEAQGWCTRLGLEYQVLSNFVPRPEQSQITSYVGNLKVTQLFDETSGDIPVGEYARRNFLHYSKGVFEIDNSTQVIARNCLSAAIITQLANRRFLNDSSKPKVITSNGKFIQSGLMIEEAIRRGVDYYTWDVFTQGGAAVFAKNSVAHDQKIAANHDADIFSLELSPERLLRLERFYERQRASKGTPFKYYKDPIVGHQDIRALYSIPTDTQIISIFANVEWDSTAIGLDVGYRDMLDFVIKTIDQFSLKSNVRIVVRCHPGEVKVPSHLKTRALFDERLKAHYGGWPPNTVLIGSDSEVSSYSLAAMSRMAMVYSSTLGIELVLSGIKPWVASSVYYSGRGFTNDIRDHRQLVKDFDTALEMRTPTCTELERARKFAYAVKFRRLFVHPLYKNNGKFSLFSCSIFSSENMSKDAITLRNIGDFVEDRRVEFDLGDSVYQ